jgi:hypothetical protein
MKNKSKVRVSWFPVVAGVVIVSSGLMGICSAREPISSIPWSTAPFGDNKGLRCNFNQKCPAANCSADSTVCAGVTMGWSTFQGAKAYGDTCLPGIFKIDHCYVGVDVIYPCAYLDYVPDDWGCEAPQCWVFPGFKGCINPPGGAGGL